MIMIEKALKSLLLGKIPSNQPYTYKVNRSTYARVFYNHLKLILRRMRIALLQREPILA